MTQSTFKMAVLVEIFRNMLIRLIMLMRAWAKVAQPTKLKLGTISSYPNGLDIVNQRCRSFPLTAPTKYHTAILCCKNINFFSDEGCPLINKKCVHGSVALKG